MQSTKIFKIERMEECFRTENAPFGWSDVQINHLANGIYAVSSTAVITRTIRKLIITFDVERCSSKEALDTCQPFASLKPVDTCILLGIKGVAWTSFVESFHPPIKCPLTKGNHTSVNATVDANRAFLFPTGSWYWRIKVIVIDGNESEHLCIDFQIINVYTKV